MSIVLIVGCTGFLPSGPVSVFLRFIEENWEILLPIAIAAFGGGVGFWRFLVVRKAELAWKKTEFLFLQGYYLDTNSDLTEVVQILEGRHPEMTLARLLSDADDVDPKQRDKYLHMLDKFLNLFDRLQYSVFELKTLSLKELEPIGWYLSIVCNSEPLKKYCEEFGYHDVIRLAEEADLED